jgi:NAD(P)-dependent dehydrogenase (short-subunit alcohol dehydrogenase family)
LNNDLTGKIVLVTGAGAGIGRVIAIRLGSLGAHVYVNDIIGDTAAAVTEEINDAGGHATSVPGDMADRGAVGDVFHLIGREQGKLDVLVTQAGVVAMPDYFSDPEDLPAAEWNHMRAEDETLAFSQFMRPDDFDFILRNDLDSTYLCCEAAVPLMEAADGGRIIAMTAAGGGISSHFSPAYGMAKGGVVGLTRALARQLLPRNIIVNCISQGFTDAGIWREVEDRFPELWERDWQVDEEGGKRVVKTTPSNRLPMQRLGRPEEIAGFVAFLISDDAAYFVGQTFNMSGGVLIP